MDDLTAQMTADPTPMSGEIIEPQPGNRRCKGDDERDEVVVEH
jgi:hypothetical protein